MIVMENIKKNIQSLHSSIIEIKYLSNNGVFFALLVLRISILFVNRIDLGKVHLCEGFFFYRPPPPQPKGGEGG